MSEHKNSVLILGGTGFIGRHLVEYLVQNDLSSKICVVDKVPPQMAWFNEHHQKIFSNPSVEFKSANLINQDSCHAAFDTEFDFVVNLAAETRLGQAESIYKEGIARLSLNCATEAARMKVKKYIELSSGQMYSSEKHAQKEVTKNDPWTSIARYKLQVEDELAQIPNLNYIILRPAYVYGIGDKTSLTPRLIMGAVYKHLQEPMKLLWNKDLKMNLVHVLDVCRAIWHTCLSSKTGETYNLVDRGDSTQGIITKLISSIFDIKHEYWGTTKSTLAKLDFTHIMDEINDKHLVPWAQICTQDNICNTPLNPYLYQELLYDKHLHLDGSKIELEGFEYQVPEITKHRLKEIVVDYMAMKLFPSVELS